MIPGVKKPTPHTQAEARSFHESEANCNTCKYLKRVKHEKDKNGFLYGHCGHNPFGHMFVMKFHPDDPMHMRCYVPRWQEVSEMRAGNHALSGDTVASQGGPQLDRAADEVSGDL